AWAAQALADLLRAGAPLPTKQTIGTGRRVGPGLEAIHSRHIVHRDLKPANIMLDRSGHAIVMDFGLAYHHERDRLTGQGAILGTLAYITPEQAHGLPTDTRTDIYAVGLLLFEMLTGKRAPGDGGTAPLRRARRRRPRPPPPPLPPPGRGGMGGIPPRGRGGPPPPPPRPPAGGGPPRGPPRRPALLRLPVRAAPPAARARPRGQPDRGPG